MRAFLAQFHEANVRINVFRYRISLVATHLQTEFDRFARIGERFVDVVSLCCNFGAALVR
jgi:hypothetical protein